ncbi:TatD DNase family protein [Evansella vedderi]|uniref:TatD DNase family protein n=1 Tax=Evansella vedderi TaxID=38282 RepID=A0ABU0A036_9BACI|nr:TatD family hydrolase [Evansella vedderi]MDQ0256331.1 TatD DNase family protein [Evansella vedderi]
MDNLIIDAHIHFDLYKDRERETILHDRKKYHIEQLISVSNNLASAKDNLFFSRKHNGVHAAFGYHPEQPLPSEQELERLHSFMDKHQHEMIGVGEVGLPYYLRRNNPGLPQENYVELLESFIIKAKKFNKPIVLHAVYGDAPIVCGLLEKYTVEKAHFHWFKGDAKTTEQMIQNGYYISITPDVIYKEKIQQLVEMYPLSNMMVETDGPWPFEGPFKNTMTHPKMIHQSIAQIAKLKKVNIKDVYKQVYKNTKSFYTI